MSRFDWERFFEVANELSATDDEAYARSATSRYYYSVFGSARYYLAETMNEEKYLHISQAHKNVCKRLKKSTDDNESALGELLENLMQRRVDADYLVKTEDNELTEDYFIKELPVVKSLTEEALEHISALKNNPPLNINSFY